MGGELPPAAREGAAESGPFSFDKIPYMVEPTNAVADAAVRSIALIKASRCSGTELINNVAAWSVERARPPLVPSPLRRRGLG